MIKQRQLTSPSVGASLPRPGSVVNEQVLQGKGLGQDEVTDVVAADGKGVVADRLVVLQRHLHAL